VQRIKCRISVAYSLESTLRAAQRIEPFRWGTLEDISERGVCFHARDQFSLHNIITLYLKHSDQSNAIKMLGKIDWMDNTLDEFTRLGVQFIGTLPSDWRRLLGGN
jgi:hypothetical protein